tara:strand:- start:186 stop:488 length:303 start_codon:yes stop_codon:yes gene_type:complete
MEREFIPYEQAVELKELGFDEPCLAWYEIDGSVLRPNGTKVMLESTQTNSNSDMVSAPLYQQAFRWLNEKLNTKGIMPISDPEYRLRMLNNLIKKLSSKK